MQTNSPTQTSLTQLIGLNRHAGSLQLRTTFIRARQSGQYLSRFKGRGMEFDESRPYQPGDDVRNIDWRVTARTGNTHSKVFREERERPVFISIDMRTPMFFATQGRFKSVIAAELAALLAWTANRQGERIGGELFNEHSHTEFRPKRGQQNVLHLLKALSLSANPFGHSAGSLQEAYRRLQRIVHPGSLVCVISDFRGLDEGAHAQLLRISRHSDVLLLYVYDQLEAALPAKGRYRVSYARRILNINADNAASRSRYSERHEAKLRALDKLCATGHMNLIPCRTDDQPLQVLRDAIGSRLAGVGKQR